MGCSASNNAAPVKEGTSPTATVSVNSDHSYLHNFITPIKVAVPLQSPLLLLPEGLEETQEEPQEELLEEKHEEPLEEHSDESHIFYGGPGRNVDGSLGHYLLQTLKKQAEAGRISQIDADSGVEWSYTDLLAHSVRTAKALEDLGLGPGDAVAFFSRNYHELFAGVLGTIMAGCTCATMAPSNTVPELTHQVRLVKPRILMTEPALLPVARGVLASCPLPFIIISLISSPDVPEDIQTLDAFSGSGAESETDLDSYNAVPISNTKDHTSFILFSSGTTGVPKGVMMSNYGLLQCVADCKGFARENETFLAMSPMSWISGVWILLFSVGQGVTRVFIPVINEVKVVRTIATRQIQRTVISPTALMTMCANPNIPDGFMSSVVSLVGGSALTTEMYDTIKKRLGGEMLNGYGATEAGLISLGEENNLRPGLIGPPSPNVYVKFVDLETEEDITVPNVTGEIRVRSPYVMQGYVGNPVATAEAFDSNGWLKTGDLGYFEEKGFICYVERLKEMIKYRSYQVAPTELESLLLTHPAVKDACVVGRPHPLDGEWPTAFIALANGQDIDVTDLHHLVADQLSDAKRLRGGIFPLEAIPRTITGKVMRKELRADLDKYPVPKDLEPKKMVRERTNEFDPGVSLAEWVLKYIRRHAKLDKIAQTDGHTGEEMSFHDLYENSVRFAKGIQLMGVKVGDTIGLVTRNYHEVFIAVLGCVFSGVTVAPSVPSSSPAELAHHLTLVAPKYVLVEKDLVNTVLEGIGIVREVLPRRPILITLQSDDFQAIIQLGKDADPDTFEAMSIKDRSDHVVFILYSSGTTGLSKGVMMSNVGLTSQLENTRSTVLNLRDTLLCSSPMSWITALHLLFFGTQRAANRILVRDSNPEFLLGIIEKYQIQSWIAAPTILLGMTDLVEAHPDQWDVSSLSDVVVGGSTMTAEVQRRIKRVFDAQIKQAYGSTETGIISFGDLEGVKLGSAGRVVPFATVQIVDPETERLLTEPGDRGELRIKPTLMKGYVGNPEETEKAFDSEDRFKTGDVGYIDKDGDLYIIDRMKEMIKYRGYQIAPAEVEGLLLQSPDIAEVCVLGRPHPEHGDLPVAFVVRAPGATITVEEIKAIVANTLSDAKKLRGGVIFIDSIPHTSTGKTMRKAMKELLEKYPPE